MLALLLLVAGSFLLPAVRWRVIGWWRGEAFYQGMPTSYWSRECQRWQELKITGSWPGADRYWIREPNWFEQHVDPILNRAPIIWSMDPLPLLRSDPLAVPVLVELLQDADINVRRIAANGLKMIGPPAKAATPALIQAAENEEMTWDARLALQAIDPEAAAKAGVK
jgi:hypothetical protein